MVRPLDARERAIILFSAVTVVLVLVSDAVLLAVLRQPFLISVQFVAVDVIPWLLL